MDTNPADNTPVNNQQEVHSHTGEHHHTTEHHHHSNEHHHHSSGEHHHHHYHSYAAHQRRKRLRAIWRWLKSALIVVLGVVSLYIIVTLYLHPQRFLFKSGQEPTKLAHNVTVVKSDDRHARLDYDGIDISHHQGDVDWNRLKLDSCVQFVYVKATEGSTILDPCYLDNIASARKVGIPVGSYHYLTSGSTVERQFSNFYGVVNRHHQDLVPVIDVEEEGVRGWTRAEVRMNLKKLLDLIAEHYHCTPIIYSYSHFYEQVLSPDFDKYPLFLSHYESMDQQAMGKGRHVIWQHTDQGTIDGINTPVDLNLFGEGVTLKDISMPH